uniref:Uncharacterized protein n=1 Tax=viral metagenome TaxID=1070528 RepID=A0A6H2A094_9ZZZZ
MKKLLALFLALVFIAGCAYFQKTDTVACDEYLYLANQLERLEKVLPPELASQAPVIKQGVKDLKNQAISCAFGEKIDPNLYSKWQQAAILIAQNITGETTTTIPTPTAESTTTTTIPPTVEITPVDPRDDKSPTDIIWVGDPAGVQNWAVAYNLSVSFKGGDIVLAQDGTKNWPEVNNAVANPWVIANLNGKWYGASFEWMRRNANTRAKSAVDGGHIKVPHTFPADWKPKAGETIYLMVASLSRGRFEGRWTWDYHNTRQRTAIKKIVWE